jgi:hypothetical protein
MEADSRWVLEVRSWAGRAMERLGVEIGLLPRRHLMRFAFAAEQAVCASGQGNWRPNRAGGAHEARFARNSLVVSTQRQGFHQRGSGPRWRADRPIMSRWRTPTFAPTGMKSTRFASSTACPSILPARPFRAMGYGRSMSSRGRWMPSYFGIASKVAGCAARNFTIPSVRPICRP